VQERAIGNVGSSKSVHKGGYCQRSLAVAAPI
jgi:hypothetical protein